MWWDQWGVYSAAWRAGNPWLFLPKGFASFLRHCPVKLALYVHDTILESYYANRRGVSALELAYFRRCFTSNLKHARLIFTNSEFTSREIERAAARRGLPVPRLANIGIGFDAPPPTGEQQRDDLILVLTGAFPHKRTDLALEYLARWQTETHYPGNLEWIGPWPATLTWPAFPNWQRHSRLPEADFRQRMARARVLIFFSDYEGFGMPPVEAVLQGVCPVFSDLPATREVMAGAAYSFQNNSYDSFASALKQALNVAPSLLDTWKKQLATRFNWDSVCERFLDAFASESA